MPSRLEEKTIWLPSGDHTGDKSREVSKVNLVGTVRAKSSSQRLALFVGNCPSRRITAASFPSGEKAGAAGNSPASPAVPEGFPFRSNQVNWRLPPAAPR